MQREVSDEQRDVLFAVAQRRRHHREDVEPVEEIRAEPTGPHRLGEVAVRGGDDAHVEFDRARAAHALDFSLLEDAQQLDLQVQRQVADLVEEDGAPVGELEPPDLARHGARERAFLVPKQLAFHQARGNRSTVHRHERPLPAPAEAMDAPRDQLFARAGLPQDQHGGVGRRDLLDLAEYGRERGALTHQVCESLLRLDLLV